MSLLRYFSLSAVVAGFVTVLVGFTSSAVIVFQAANAVGAGAGQIASWMWALGLGMGITCIALSLRYRMPVVTAWSTPGAAMLITGAAGVSLAEATGAFLVSGLMITIVGFSGWFERAINRIPVSIASGMLAGVLLRFGLDLFIVMKAQFLMAFAMFAAYLVMRRLFPRYAVITAFAMGIVVATVQGSLHMETVHVELAMPVWVTPGFSASALIGVALPLFVVTMASQNVPGVAVIRASGYPIPPNTWISQATSAQSIWPSKPLITRRTTKVVSRCPVESKLTSSRDTTQSLPNGPCAPTTHCSTKPTSFGPNPLPRTATVC